MYRCLFMFICFAAFQTFFTENNIKKKHITSNEIVSVNKIQSHAKQYRVDPTLPQDKEQARLKKILEDTSHLLPHYKVKDQLKDTIKEFVADILSINVGDISDYIITDTRTTEFYGKSHDIVFLIQDHNAHVRYIVKAFQNPSQLSGRFLSEISAMELIRELSLPGIVPIEPIAFAICHEENEEWGLLLESVAPGKRIDQYIIALGNTKEPSERKQVLEFTETVFKRMGESMARLHSVTSVEKMQLHPSIIKKFDDKLIKILKDQFIVDELSKYFPISQLTKYVHEVKNAALQVPLYRTYSHGDTNMGNIFYDEVTDSISFIDLFGLHQSVTITGEPISDPIIDLVRTANGFIKKANSILTPQEIDLLMTSFYSAYRDINGSTPDEVHLHFYKTYINLWRLILGCHYIDEEDPIRREFDKATFDEAVDYFKKQLSIY